METFSGYLYKIPLGKTPLFLCPFLEVVVPNSECCVLCNPVRMLTTSKFNAEVAAMIQSVTGCSVIEAV